METSGKISGKTLGAEIAEISRAEIFPETDNPEFPSVKSFPERKLRKFPAGSSLSQGVAFPTTLGYN